MHSKLWLFTVYLILVLTIESYNTTNKNFSFYTRFRFQMIFGFYISKRSWSVNIIEKVYESNVWSFLNDLINYVQIFLCNPLIGSQKLILMQTISTFLPVVSIFSLIIVYNIYYRNNFFGNSREYLRGGFKISRIFL